MAKMIRCPWCHNLFEEDKEKGKAEHCADCGRPLVVPQHLDYIDTPRGKVCIPCHNSECTEKLSEGGK